MHIEAEPWLSRQIDIRISPTSSKLRVYIIISIVGRRCVLGFERMHVIWISLWSKRYVLESEKVVMRNECREMSRELFHKTTTRRKGMFLHKCLCIRRCHAKKKYVSVLSCACKDALEWTCFKPTKWTWCRRYDTNNNAESSICQPFDSSSHHRRHKSHVDRSTHSFLQNQATRWCL